MHIKTTATNCHVTVNIKIENLMLLSLVDNAEGDVSLLPGITYRFEWFVFTASNGGQATIEAVVSPDNTGFLPLSIDNTYPVGVKDGNVFLFTLN